ncbi:MAG: EAL domain-containing protein [Lachnospiraceae bacterium]|nr:EAL domain-containing protein [Lachnospiraceae bacterium]
MNMDVFGSLLNEYFTYFFVISIIIFIVFTNRNMYHKIRYKFIALIVIEVVETIAARAEVYYYGLDHPTLMRVLLSTLCYILRPSIVYIMVLILTRDRDRKFHLLLGIPLFVASVIIIADIPFKNVFWFTEKNTFETGNLFPVTYMSIVVYLVMILLLNIARYGKSLDLNELLTVFIGVGFVILNIIGERKIPHFGGQSEITTGLAVLLYAIFFKNIEDKKEKQNLETREQKTGLLNENACVKKLNDMRSTGDITEFAAVYFDLARFGFINDRYGMEIGNIVLVQYAKQLSEMLRSDELLARQGSDRFIAVVLKRNMDLFLDVLASSRVKFNENGKDYDIEVKARAGVYMIDDRDILGVEIISGAYAALTYGKSAGNQVTYLTPGLRARLRDDKQFEMDIPVGMANEEFVPYYQPKVNSRTGMLCGAEALVRWVKNGQLIPPGKFIPVMETKDMMCDMDFYMLRHVCADISKWIEEGLVPPTISVNFSRRNLSNKNLASDIDRVVTGYHVPKKLIEIEITETIDEFPISVLNGFVEDLHKLGYKVAVDDFGSGSSSLSLLREVSFDTLKIDKGFVDRAFSKDLTILGYMIKLSLALGIEILAEGVEQREQVDTLLTMGCEVIQGYYFDRPLPGEDFEQRIINRRYTNV